MFVKRQQTGYALIVVLIVGSLFSLFIQDLVNLGVIEYQRARNQILTYQLWQRLELELHAVVNKLQTNTHELTLPGKMLGYVPDTLVIYCPSGITSYELMAQAKQESVALFVTYALRVQK